MSRFELGAGRRGRGRAWVARHLQAGLSSLGLMARAPLPSLMTAAVIGIAMALPAAFYVLLDNAQRIGRGWDGVPQISVFLRPEIDERRAARLARELELDAQVRAVTLISRAEALAEYKRLSGFGEVLEAFGEDNPLPVVLVIEPRQGRAGSAPVETLVARLRQRPEVELAQFDLAWLRRFEGIVALVRRAVWLLVGLLALGVVLIVGNTIRLTIDGRRDEIEIAKLFGASHAFVRRPFLYSGLWYGLAGGLIAAALVGATTALLRGPVADLALLYRSQFELAGLGPGGVLGLAASGTLLGLGGAWAAVGRHLRAIDPA